MSACFCLLVCSLCDWIHSVFWSVEPFFFLCQQIIILMVMETHLNIAIQKIASYF